MALRGVSSGGGGIPVTISGGRGVGTTNTAVPATGWNITSGQWYYDGVAISGATSLTYGPRLVVDIGKRLTFVASGLPYTADGGVTVAVAPAAPTIGTASAGDGQASVAFTAPSNNGGSTITGYAGYAYGSDGSTLGPQTTVSSPLNFTGLTNGVSYTFKVAAINAIGMGTLSAASNSITPQVSPTVFTYMFIERRTGGDAIFA